MNDNYTMSLYEIINNFYTRSEVESWFEDYQLTDYLTQDQIDVIEETGIWNKNKLATKIVDHYYMREIGFETIPLFKHYVKITMNELMEKYLPLIYSSAIQYDPLVNVDYTETFERTKTDEITSESSSNGSGLSVSSDTPQGQINKTSILAGSYASSTNANEQTTSLSDSTSNSTDEDYTKRIKGNSGVSATAQKMIEQYRQNIIAIDKEIINELQPLFMGLY